MLKALFVSALLIASSAWASDFSLQSDDQTTEAMKLLKEVNDIFPEHMKEVIDAKITVKFTDLNGRKLESLNEVCPEKASDRVSLGQVVKLFPGQRSATLVVDRVVLQGVLNPVALKCTYHSDSLAYAKSILVHELSHFYDFRSKASNEATFLNLAGWVSKGIILKKRTNLNTAKERSPDPYEFKNPAETFAVNFEFFLLDKTFKCRRPSYYSYYRNLLKMDPFENNDCEMNKKVTLISQSIEKKAKLTKEIDVNRIYQIHYLFAGKGKEMMSRWGHAMFRIVLCAPGKEIGPSCLQDFSEHVVVSYRANIEDMTMNYKKGIDGGYASQLFLMNMSDVVNEYTKGEFRDVISLPMNFNRDQIKRFTDKLLENYWSYKGSYFFITNNCASEAMNLLRAAYPYNKLMQSQAITTPLGLYDFLIKSKLVDVSVLDDTKEAVRLGHLFQGVSEKLMSSLKVLNIKMSFEQFALELKAAERRAIYEDALATSSLKRPMLLGNALRLEDQILISREQQFAKKIGEALFGKKQSEELKDTVLDERIIEIRDEYKKLAAENFITRGYGVPLRKEFRDISDKIIEEVMNKMQGRAEELKEISLKYFPDEVMEIKDTLENRIMIFTELSKI